MKLAVVSDKDNRVIYLRPLPRPSKHGDRLTPVTKVISEKSGDALYRIAGKCVIFSLIIFGRKCVFVFDCNLNGSRRLLAGTAVSVEVARVRRDLLKLNTYHVEFELSTVSILCCYLVRCYACLLIYSNC